MNTQVKIPDIAELIVIEDKDALATFTTPGMLDPILAKVRAHIDAFQGDTSTKEGREQIKKMAFAVTKSKTALKDIGDRLAKDAKELPGKIDKGRKLVNDTLDSWRDEVRKPLTDWEVEEDARVQRHTRELEQIKALVAMPPGTMAEIRSTIAAVETYSDGPDREEFQDGFRLAKASALKSLAEKLVWRETYDAEQAELARHRAEAAKREAEDAERRRVEAEAARAKADAEARAAAVADAERRVAAAAEARAKADAEAAEKRAQAERDAAVRREAELKEQAQAAERRAAEADTRAKAEIEAQQAAERAATEARERDKAHRGRINLAAINALIKGGVPEANAKIALTMIVRGEVPSVSIRY